MAQAQAQAQARAQPQAQSQVQSQLGGPDHLQPRDKEVCHKEQCRVEARDLVETAVAEGANKKITRVKLKKITRVHRPTRDFKT